MYARVQWHSHYCKKQKIAFIANILCHFVITKGESTYILTLIIYANCPDIKAIRHITKQEQDRQELPKHLHILVQLEIVNLLLFCGYNAK